MRDARSTQQKMAFKLHDSDSPNGTKLRRTSTFSVWCDAPRLWRHWNRGLMHCEIVQYGTNSDTDTVKHAEDNVT